MTAACWDVGQDDGIVASFGPTPSSSLIDLRRWKKREKEWQVIASWDAPCPLPDLECDKVLDLHHFPDLQTTCLILAGGDLIVVREDPLEHEEKIEIVGSVDVGIAAAGWSPDEELLAIATNASTVLYMTRDFENTVNLNLSVEDLKVSNHVSVGWGKKETQFKGKKARALRDPTVPETVDEGLLHPSDDRTTTISWRGDGAYFVVNSIENPRRIIRVFSREGVLDSVSEPVDNLLGALSWRPEGNLIAGIQLLEKTAKVVFFERNGLRHGQFDLRLSAEELLDLEPSIKLKWNVDSSVLAICLRKQVQLWTMGNYHYYLKQELDDIQGFCWHPEKPLHFTAWNDDIVQTLAYASVVTNSPTSSPNDYGLIPVIDGRSLKVTPLRFANVPPPMAFCEIQIDHPIIDIAVSVQDKTILIAILSRHNLELWEMKATSIQDAPNRRWQVPMHVKAPTMRVQLAFNVDVLCILQSAVTGWGILLVARDGVKKNAVQGMDQQPQVLTNHVVGKVSKSILVVGDHSDASITDGRAQTMIFPSSKRLGVAYQKSTKQTVNCAVYGFPSQTVQRSDTNTNPQDTRPPTNGNGETTYDAGVNGDISHEQHIIFHLDEQGSLFANDRCLARGCTSFTLTPAHLIFTTTQLLKFVHLAQNVETLEIPADNAESDERCRSIERGARLVTVMPSIFALVLQMPRGNLETIYPRALVLAGIRRSISRKQYRKAFFACRNHRVDLNILHDHNPEQLRSNIGLFVDQVQKTEHIDLFLSSLRNEDVSRIMYKETLTNPETQMPSQATVTDHNSKINAICDRFLAIFKDKASGRLQNTLTAHVCKSPPDLDAALMQIEKIRKSDSRQKVDALIEHICFLVDVNKLYDNALGLYCLELTLLVAQQSQKDPREYLPFLQNLQQMLPLRRQFSIDDILRRHVKALKSLLDLDAFDEVKSYVVKHNLYQQALEHYRYRDDKLQDIMRIYAEHLEQTRRFREAGIAYESLKDHGSACEAFRQAHLWRESLSNASFVPFEPSRLQSLARDLSDDMVETKDFHSAALINQDYLSDLPTAAKLFCKGYHFPNAVRLAALHQRLDLLEAVIDPGLVEGMATMTELLADCKSQLHAQIPRIRELRAKKAEDPLAYWEGDIPGGGDVPDDVSIAPTDASTTGGSLFTRYTNRTGTVGTNATRRTSKNRRREERKRARGKKGSVYEEEYLVHSVARLIERVNSVNEEVGRLVTALAQRGMRERARAVQSAILDVIEMCNGCLDEVFQGGLVKESDDPNLVRDSGEDYRLQGADGVLAESLEESSKPQKAPVVKGFDGLALLGG